MGAVVHNSAPKRRGSRNLKQQLPKSRSKWSCLPGANRCGYYSKTSRHAQMDQQSAFGHPQQQILARRPLDCTTWPGSCRDNSTGTGQRSWVGAEPAAAGTGSGCGERRRGRWFPTSKFRHSGTMADSVGAPTTRLMPAGRRPGPDPYVAKACPAAVSMPETSVVSLPLRPISIWKSAGTAGALTTFSAWRFSMHPPFRQTVHGDAGESGGQPPCLHSIRHGVEPPLRGFDEIQLLPCGRMFGETRLPPAASSRWGTDP